MTGLEFEELLNTYADTYLDLFNEFVSREKITNDKDVEIAYTEWFEGYAQPDYYDGVYLSPSITIEYQDDDGYVVFGCLVINYEHKLYEIPIYDSVAGHYEEYPLKIIALADSLLRRL